MRASWVPEDINRPYGYSVDTVKTRVQGQPHHRPLKYHSMIQAYKLIWKEEGILRGLYAGVTPAMLGSGLCI